MFPFTNARGLPGISPSGREQFPRLQLRGSAGFSPASLSSPSGKDARSERYDKDQKQPPQESNGRPCRSQIWWPILAAFFAARVGMLISIRYLESISTQATTNSVSRQACLTFSTSPPHTAQSKSPRSPPPRSPEENKTSYSSPDKPRPPATVPKANSPVPPQ